MTSAQPNVTPQDEDEGQPAPTWLKILVVGLGLGIVAMVGLILFRIFGLMNGGQAETQGIEVPVSAQSPGVTSPLMLPAKIKRPHGMELVNSRLEGGYLTLHFRGTEGDQLVFVNSITGEQKMIRIPAKPNGDTTH